MTKKQTNLTLSPEKYIKTKGRNLSISDCWINQDWQKNGLANIELLKLDVFLFKKRMFFRFFV